MWKKVPEPVVIEEISEALPWRAKNLADGSKLWAVDTEADGLATFGPNKCRMRCFSMSEGLQRVYLSYKVLPVLAPG